MGGVGKTQTALAYVHKMKYYYDYVFWISGVNHATLLSGYHDIASKTGCMTNLSDTDALRVAKKMLDWFQIQRNWLLVIDNVDDVTVIKGLVPSTESKGHTLITTRNPNTKGIPAEGIELDVLGLDEAMELFSKLSNVTGWSSDSTSSEFETKNVVEELGRLPLAIEQAAAYIRETGRNINDYLVAYRESRDNRKILHNWIPDGIWNYERSLATTWKISVDLIDKKCPEAVRLLHLFAFLNPDIIMLDFLRDGAKALDEDLQVVVVDTLKLDSVLLHLQRFSLIKRMYGGQSIQIHRVVQESIQIAMTEKNWLNWWRIVGNLCFEAFPSELEPRNWLVCRTYEEQLTVPLSKSPIIKTDDAIPRACSMVAVFLLHEGKFKQAEILARKAHQSYTEIHNDRHPDTLRAMANLAGTYMESGAVGRGGRAGGDGVGGQQGGAGRPAP